MPQTFIAGTEPPGRSPEIDDTIAQKYERLAQLKLAREAVRVSDAKLLELMEEQGRALYPFTEPGTGKRKKLKLDAAKKLKTVAGKSAKTEQADQEWEAQQAEHRGGERRAAGRVEVESHGFGVVAPPDDPFAATRSAMETPAQSAAREAEEARAARRAKRA